MHRGSIEVDVKGGLEKLQADRVYATITVYNLHYRGGSIIGRNS